MKNQLNNSTHSLQHVNYKTFAFTLAEVLITLGIIGVIGALTIPSLIKNTQNEQYVAGFKKTISILNGAISMMKNDNGGSIVGVYPTVDDAIDGFCSELKCTKICHTTDTQTNCFHGANWKTLDGRPGWDDYSTIPGASAILNDGMLIRMNAGLWSGDCSSPRYVSGACTSMAIDTNGFKAPNVFGRDIFDTFITPDKVVPDGALGTNLYDSINTYCDPTLTTNGNGASCGARIMTEGGMKY